MKVESVVVCNFRGGGGGESQILAIGRWLEELAGRGIPIG